MYFEMGNEGDVLLFQASGVINSLNFEKWESSVKSRAAHEHPRSILLDLRRVEYNGTLLELRHYAKQLVRYDQVRMAVVMQEGYQFGLARAALLLAKLSPRDHRVFRHVCNARRWVGLPIGPRPLFWRYRCTCKACSEPLLAAA